MVFLEIRYSFLKKFKLALGIKRVLATVQIFDRNSNIRNNKNY